MKNIDEKFRMREAVLARHPQYRVDDSFNRLKKGKNQTKEEAKLAKNKARIERATKMFALYKAGKTLQEIGNKYCITREAVRILLCRNFPEYQSVVKEKQAIRKEKSQYKKVTTNECQECNKVFLASKYVQQKYCSQACVRKRLTKNQYPDWVNGRPIRKKFFTADEWRQINNIRCKAYYQRNSRRVIEARKKKYDAKRQYIIQKRCKERKIHGKAITPLKNPRNIYALKD